MMILDKFIEFEKTLYEIESQLSQQSIIQDQKKFQLLSKEHSRLASIVKDYHEYTKFKQDLKEAKELLDESELEQDSIYLREEVSQLHLKIEEMELKLKAHLIPPGKDDDKDVIVEIRAGTGGDEASIFAHDLFRMYSKYAEQKGWKLEIFNSSRTAGNKGIKEIIFSLHGDYVYHRLRFESGVHRVQRVPVTEASGRIHTSAATVFVMPEADEVEVEINPKDIRIDVFRSSGSGGQHVNTTDSAVRIIHIPTNIMVSCQDEKSQIKNRAKAMRVLRARLKDKLESEAFEKQSHERKLQVQTGDRSEKIRTYNYPQNRITDHRIKLTVHNLMEVLEGFLDEIISTILAFYAEELLKENL